MKTKYRHYITVVLVPLFMAALLLAGCGKAIKNDTGEENTLDGTDNTAPITTAEHVDSTGTTITGGMSSDDDLIIGGSVKVKLACLDFGGGGGGGGASGGGGGYGPILSKSHPSGCAQTYYSMSEDAMQEEVDDPTITYSGPITVTGGRPDEALTVRLKFFSIDEAANREIFREVTYYFDPMPTVVETTPANDDASVAANAVLTAEFSEDMDGETITMDSFKLKKRVGGDVAGDVSYDADSKTATFTPNADLVENKGYIATITTAVTDAAGDAMVEDYSWMFATSVDGGPPPPSATYTVGGSVSGLTGSGLVLQNNASDDLAIDAAGTFTFATAIDDGTDYAVTVSAQPSGQTCSVTNGGGTISANVTDVAVTCIDVGTGLTAGGIVSGLTGSGLVLQNNASDDLAIDADGAFNFTEQADGTDYAVTVSAQPSGQTCSVTNGGGTISGADVTDIAVTCVDDVAVVGYFDLPPTQTASNTSYGDNTFGLITAGTLQSWQSDWAASKAALGISGKLIILQVGSGSYVGGTGSGVDCDTVSSYDAPYNTIAPYEETRSNGLFDTVSMVVDGASADVYLKMFNIDPVNDMVVMAMNAYSSTNFFLHGRIYYMLRYWGMAAENLALLNGSVSDSSGLDTVTSKPCGDHPNNGTLTVQGLPDNTGLQASTGEMLAVARGDYTPSGGAFLWDVRRINEYNGVQNETPAESGNVAFEGTIKVGNNSGGWLEWKDSNLINGSTGAFASKDSLKTVLSGIGDGYNAATNPADGPVIYTWCRTAWRAMSSYIVASVILGYPTKIYDGSWIEYGRLTDGNATAVYSAENTSATDNGPTTNTGIVAPTGIVANPTTASQIIIDDKAYKGTTWTSGLAVSSDFGGTGEEY